MMMEKNELEIMAPAGNFECLMAAIEGGADSVYFGIGNLNMRSHSANNFQPEDLDEIVRICREHGVKTYLTLNIVLYQEDLEPARRALDAAKTAGALVEFGQIRIKISRIAFTSGNFTAGCRNFTQGFAVV